MNMDYDAGGRAFCVDCCDHQAKISAQNNLLEEARKIILGTIRNKKILLGQMETGETEKRLKFIGADIYDPDHKVRWLLAYKALSSVLEPKTEKGKSNG